MLRRADLRLAPRASRFLRSGRVTTLAVLAAVGCSGRDVAEIPATQRNLLLVTIDTLRPDALACYGGDPGVGAFLCSLADHGTRFEWAFSTAPYTAPSVASVLTGVYPYAHGVRQSAVSFLRRDLDTLPELLRDAGYKTAAFISNPMLDRSRQLDQGFDVFDQQMTRKERNRPGFVEREARATTDSALAWAQVAAEPPWFLWVHYQDPHGPYEPPDASVGYDAPGDRRLPVLIDDHSGAGGIPQYQVLPGLFTVDGYRERYRDEIRYLDGHLKRLVEGVDALGDSPAILLTSDHGEAFGEDDYYFAHGHSVGIDQIHVPLLWRPPSPAPPAVVSTPVSLVDIAPTFLRAAGITVPEGWPGQPLPVAGDRAERPPSGRAIFAEHGLRAAVVTGDHYYARDRHPVVANLPDPNSGGRVRALPARTAHLDGGSTTTRYETIDPKTQGGDLEAELSDFLKRARRGPAGGVHEEVSNVLRERLRALGYGD